MTKKADKGKSKSSEKMKVSDRKKNTKSRSEALKKIIKHFKNENE